MLLIFSYGRHSNIERKSKLNLKLVELRKKLMDLHDYSSSIADGNVSLNDLMKVPPSQFNRMSVFMMYSHQSAMAGAQEKYAYMSQVPGAVPQMQTPQLQQQFSQMMFKNLYDQERQKFQKVEEKLLNNEDKKIEQEIEKIKTDLQMIEADDKNLESAQEKGAQESSAKYVA